MARFRLSRLAEDDLAHTIAPGLIEIVRVLHKRMEPSRHAGAGSADRLSEDHEG